MPKRNSRRSYKHKRKSRASYKRKIRPSMKIHQLMMSQIGGGYLEVNLPLKVLDLTNVAYEL